MVHRCATGSCIPCSRNTYSTLYTSKGYSGISCHLGHLIHEIKDNRKHWFNEKNGSETCLSTAEWSGTNRATFELYPEKKYVVFHLK